MMKRESSRSSLSVKIGHIDLEDILNSNPHSTILVRQLFTTYEDHNRFSPHRYSSLQTASGLHNFLYHRTDEIRAQIHVHFKT